MKREYRVVWRREGMERAKWRMFATLPAAKRHAARIGDGDVHWMCDESHGYVNNGPDGPTYSCLSPVIEGPRIDERSVYPWHELAEVPR